MTEQGLMYPDETACKQCNEKLPDKRPGKRVHISTSFPPDMYDPTYFGYCDGKCMNDRITKLEAG